MTDKLRQHTDQAHADVLADGQDLSDAAVYVNYAVFDTPLQDIYGQNVPRLRKIRGEIDPEGIMGLAGGFESRVDTQHESPVETTNLVRPSWGGLESIRC